MIGSYPLIVRVVRKFTYRSDISPWWNEVVGRELLVVGPPLPKKLFINGKVFKYVENGEEKDYDMAYHVLRIVENSVEVTEKWLPMRVCEVLKSGERKQK